MALIEGIYYMRRALFAVLSATLMSGCSGGGSSSLVSVSQTLTRGAAPTPALASATAASAARTAQALFAAYNFDTIYDFTTHPADGYNSQATLLDVNGTLYGETLYGGAIGNGTIFSVTPTGTETVIYSFKGNSLDGAFPSGTLIAVNGTLYGTTQSGGATSYGTVFSVAPTGSEQVLYTFKGGADGRGPQAGLVNVNGTLYGTTLYGGTGTCKYGYGCGTVFSITTSGAEQVLHSFGGAGDGYWPKANLVNVGGTLYGTTFNGGGNGLNAGTVFSITTSGVEQVLHSFGQGDGEFPSAGLVNLNGTLYGTTTAGGTGNGTVYSITPTGTEEVVYSFAGGSDGAGPDAGLIDDNGTLYGTTTAGGNGAPVCNFGCGTVFSVTTAGTEAVLHAFTGGGDGRYPVAGLEKVKGLLFGVTAAAGDTGFSRGTVFRLRP